LNNNALNLQTDRLCLIPYADILNDKQYSNVGEYLLRPSPEVSKFLILSSADDRVVRGECSDFDLLCAFLEAATVCGGRASAVVKNFEKAVSRLLGHGSVLSMTADQIWLESLEKLALDENRTVNLIARSGLQKIGIPISVEDYAKHTKTLFCGDVEMDLVGCPFGTQNVSFDTVDLNCSFEKLCERLFNFASSISKCALFFDDFSFEKPNEYGASIAYEKLSSGQKLSSKESAMLSSQLMRVVSRAVCKSKGELMIFLPAAPNLASMWGAQNFVEYLDDGAIDEKLNVTIFARDAVGACMSAAMAGKRYKKIAAVTGMCGNGSGMPDVSASEYWGCGIMTFSNRASLAANAGYLSSL
jgi:hypothetical protein